MNKNLLVVPSGRLALDPTKLKSAKKVAKDLVEGRPVQLGDNGDTTGKERTKLTTQPGKLALDPTKIKSAKKVAKDLVEGRPVQLGDKGDTTGKERTELTTQPGKLAAQWYERDPQMLDDEIDLMRQSTFKNFELYKLEDGSMCWIGTVKPGFMEDMEWELLAIYPPNYPTPVMGGTVRVYLRQPTVEDVHDALGYYPHHLINDGEGGKFLCTTRAEDLTNTAHSYSTAVTTLALAVKWLTALELVMIGELSEADFNRPDGI